jgi:hypothetical protein
MADHLKAPVVFRVTCKDQNGEITWKITDNLEDAIGFIDRLEPRHRKHCEWLVYEISIGGSPRIVHREVFDN